MKNAKVILVSSFFALLVAAGVFMVGNPWKQEVAVRWSAYEDHGDKPGVEFVLTEGTEGTTGFLVVRDANNYERIIERIPMEVKRVASDEYLVSFKVGKRIERLSIKYRESADGKTRTATVRDPDSPVDSDADPEVLIFKPVTGERAR